MATKNAEAAPAPAPEDDNLTTDGQPIKSREEVLAELAANDNRVDVNLFGADGAARRSFKLPPENATRIIVFEGVRYEKIGDSDWQEMA